MVPKRPHDADAARPSKKQKKGFSVGPAHLPDGPQKRKVQKIKKDLIHKAKLKKQYAKLKAREQAAAATAPPFVYDRNGVSESRQPETAPAPQPTLEPHPDGTEMLEEGSPEAAPASAKCPEGSTKRSRPQPFQREMQLAQKKQAEAEARRRAREAAERERAQKRVERERQRKIMLKAHGTGQNGRPKLGRESLVLLEKAKRLVGKA